MAGTATKKNSPKARTVARPRKELDPNSPDIRERFAAKLRAMVDRKRWSYEQFHEHLVAAGLDVSIASVRKWLNAERTPQFEHMQSIADVFDVKDYRHILPPPFDAPE